jgi:hypothetical protein
MGNVLGECHTKDVFVDFENNCVVVAANTLFFILSYSTLRTISVVDPVDQSLPSFLKSFYIMIGLVLVMDIADILLIGLKQ